MRKGQNKLKPVIYDDDIRFLYELLKERPSYANISHQNMPSYTQHKRYVLSRPYDVWFIIWNNNIRVGSIYKTKLGELGIFVKKEYQHQGIATDVVPMVYGCGVKDNISNVNPKNEISIGLFKKLGFEHIQNTYKLRGLVR